MKKLILTTAILFISFANIFAQEFVKTNLRINVINNIEFSERLDCEFIIGNKCEFIALNNIDHNIISAIQLISFVESSNFHYWKIDTYKSTYDDIVKIYYDGNKIYAIKLINPNGFETLYIKTSDTKVYPQASK